MAIEKTISIVGQLNEADVVERNKLDDIFMASGKLTKLFNFEATLPANTVDQDVSFQDATLATFVFIRVDVVDGGDCTIKLQDNQLSPNTIVIPCTGGEIWLNKTQIKSIKVSSVSGADVRIIGGGIS